MPGSTGESLPLRTCRLVTETPWREDAACPQAHHAGGCAEHGWGRELMPVTLRFSKGAAFELTLEDEWDVRDGKGDGWHSMDPESKVSHVCIGQCHVGSEES